MGCENGSEISEFILLGLSSRPGPQPFLALLFLLLYVAGVLGNSLMVALTTVDPRFHSPMYSLLRSLSLVDVGLLSVTVPQALAHALSGRRARPFRACLAQFFFFYLFGVSNTLLLVAAALDHYVAIGDPPVLPSRDEPPGLPAPGGLLPRPGRPPRRAAAETQPPRREPAAPRLLQPPAPAAPLLLPDTGQRGGHLLRLRPGHPGTLPLHHGSHLTTVALFYGAIVGVYFQPRASYSAPRGAIFSVTYTVVTPAAKLFVYSLHNKDVQGALRRLMGRGGFSQMP
ncbi:unnamed protein product [Eretmochelys imbricata]